VKRYLYLTPVLGGPGAPRFPVTEEAQLIGRSESADISLLEPTISRRHASVWVDGDRVRLKDLGSKHGTFVNSRRVTSAELRVGDIVVFGLSLVLRIEASNDPVLAPERPSIPLEAPTLIDPLDQLTAVRGAPLPPEGNRPANGEATAVVRTDDVATVCTSLIPEAHVRLSELRMSLKRMVDDGIDETDPYPILASVESVLSTLNRVLQGIGVEEDMSPRIVKLRGLVRRVVGRVAQNFAQRQIKFMADIPDEYHVRCDAACLEGALALLLRAAGGHSPDGNPVEILATAEGKTITLTISHLGRVYPADVLERSKGRGDPTPLLRDMGEVQHLLRMIGSAITVESRTGIGSTVRLVLSALTT